MTENVFSSNCKIEKTRNRENCEKQSICKRMEIKPADTVGLFII